MLIPSFCVGFFHTIFVYVRLGTPGRGRKPAEPSTPGNGNSEKSASTDEKAKGTQKSPFCDFCLGDKELNKKSGKPEEMCSCAECGRSGELFKSIIILFLAVLKDI